MLSLDPANAQQDVTSGSTRERPATRVAANACLKGVWRHYTESRWEQALQIQLVMPNTATITLYQYIRNAFDAIELMVIFRVTISTYGWP